MHSLPSDTNLDSFPPFIKPSVLNHSAVLAHPREYFELRHKCSTSTTLPWRHRSLCTTRLSFMTTKLLELITAHISPPLQPRLRLPPQPRTSKFRISQSSIPQASLNLICVNSIACNLPSHLIPSIQIHIKPKSIKSIAKRNVAVIRSTVRGNIVSHSFLYWSKLEKRQGRVVSDGKVEWKKVVLRGGNSRGYLG